MFESLKALPADAILGIMTLFRADSNPRKVDLSVGVYQDETGRTPVLDCVKRAEREIVEEQDTKTYVAIGVASRSVEPDASTATVNGPGPELGVAATAAAGGWSAAG